VLRRGAEFDEYFSVHATNIRQTPERNVGELFLSGLWQWPQFRRTT
jgi:hypothetical protein